MCSTYDLGLLVGWRVCCAIEFENVHSQHNKTELHVLLAFVKLNFAEVQQSKTRSATLPCHSCPIHDAHDI